MQIPLFLFPIHNLSFFVSHDHVGPTETAKVSHPLQFPHYLTFPLRQIHPHHEILPEEFQTTDQGREAARQAAAEKESTLATMSAKLALTDLLPLPNSSVKIPRLGFGIYQSHSQTAVKSCLHALRTGYRHIDSAQFYGNEVEMGEAVRQSGLKRSEVFLTTKILSAGGSPEATYKKCIESVDKVEGGRAGGYVDLFLIHTPSGGPAARKEMWQALERLVDEGRAKSIGVSNFGVGHIEEMKAWAKIWPPQVNQIEVFLPVSFPVPHPKCLLNTS